MGGARGKKSAKMKKDRSDSLVGEEKKNWKDA